LRGLVNGIPIEVQNHDEVFVLASAANADESRTFLAPIRVGRSLHVALHDALQSQLVAHRVGHEGLGCEGARSPQPEDATQKQAGDRAKD
jgi:hypothetical protein